MQFDTAWRDLRDALGSIDPETVLVTPVSGEPFTVEAVEDDRIVVEFVRGDGERVLGRDQFEVLHDRLDADPDGMSIAELPSGVEPYVSVASLSSRYVVDESADTIRVADAGDRGESPFLRPEWTVRTPPERLRDDAVLLVDALGRHDVDDPGSLPPDDLVDLYVLLSDVQRESDGLRKETGDHLLEHIGPGGRRHGQFGTVTRTTRKRRRLRDEETVFAALDDEDVPHEWVLGVDPEKLDVVLAVTDVDESEVYELREQVYVQKTAVEEAEKQSRLQGLKDRLADLDTEEAVELREEIEDLEDRLETVLAAG